MDSSDFKYLLAYLTPVFGFLGFYYQSWMSPGSFYLGFIIIPVLEFILPVSANSDMETQMARTSDKKFFDILLYLNLPILYSLMIYFLVCLDSQSINLSTWIFLVLNMGILSGVLGINVAHELGHRNHWFDKLVAQLLLLPSLYMHFTIQHNNWHHKYVSTPSDHSSARINEVVYSFWLRSIVGGIVAAYKLERKRLKNQGHSFIHWKNYLFYQILIQIVYLTNIAYFLGWFAFLSVLISALIAILLLETINYIEHYGLRREATKSGQYEKVNPSHSWNSNHSLGRIFMYELTRHPHHHQKTSVKYQNLQNLQKSPQLPFGYPASMLLSLVPSLWIRKMNSLFKPE